MAVSGAEDGRRSKYSCRIRSFLRCLMKRSEVKVCVLVGSGEEQYSTRPIYDIYDDSNYKKTEKMKLNKLDNTNQYYSMHSLHIKSKPISGPLLEAISNLLKDEHIDLTEEPYSDCSGFCGIPPALVQRYAEEVNEDVYDVADAVDHIRLKSLVVRGRIGIPNDFLGDSCSGLVIEQANCESLHSWLVSIGLPMCEKLLIDKDYTNLTQIATLKECDLLNCGITKATHRRLLIAAICALNVNLDKV